MLAKVRSGRGSSPELRALTSELAFLHFSIANINECMVLHGLFSLWMGWITDAYAICFLIRSKLRNSCKKYMSGTTLLHICYKQTPTVSLIIQMCACRLEP